MNKDVFTKGSTPTIELTIRDKQTGEAVPLTGAAIEITGSITKTPQIINSDSGLIQFDLTKEDTAKTGFYFYRGIVKLQGEKEFPSFRKSYEIVD